MYGSALAADAFVCDVQLAVKAHDRVSLAATARGGSKFMTRPKYHSA